MDAANAWPHIFAASRERRVCGSLSLLPPLLLLEAAERNGQDCRLTMRDPSGGNLLIVLFREGRPTMVFSPGDGRSLGELLLGAGVIDHRVLTELLQWRAVERGPLERLLQGRIGLGNKELQRFFNFQARARLLEALAWRAGSFELESYSGDEESEFRLELPSFAALAMRAQARAETLARLLPALPAPPEHLLVRRRSAAVAPEDDIQAAVLAALGQPRSLPQLVARLLLDDDLVLQAVVALEQSRGVILQPRLAPVAGQGALPGGPSAFAGELLKGVVRRLRGGDGTADSALWVLVVGEESGQAREVVTRLGGSAMRESSDASFSATTVARARVRIAPHAMLCAVAVEPESLSRGAADPLLARFDVLCAVLGGGATPKLDALLDKLPPKGGPLLVGLDLGGGSGAGPARLRGWLRVDDLARWNTRGLAGLLIELMHGAASQV